MTLTRQPSPTRFRPRPTLGIAARRYAAPFVLMALQTLCAASQVEVGTGHVSPATAFGTFGGENTNLPAYTDNALGFDLGMSYQPHPLAGLEFRASAYPFSARYLQMGFTGGYRIARHTAFGFPYAPFLYFGGGWARSQDKGPGKAAYPPVWEPCWQADIGFDRPYHSFSWRVFQASWRQTYTPLHRLRSLGLATGVTYRFR